MSRRLLRTAGPSVLTVLAMAAAFAGVDASANDAGAAVSTAASTSAGAVTDATHFLDTFSSGRLDGWSRIDEGSRYGPSRWRVSNRALHQTSNIYGGPSTRTGLAKPGTMLTFGNTSWTDVDYSVSLSTGDDDAIGVVFRYKDRNNYYRFSMDRQRGYRRLVAKVNGRYRLLAESRGGYVKRRVYRVRTVSVGSRLKVLLNGSTVFHVTDSRLTRGKVGLYTWGSSSTTADGVSVDARTDGAFTIAVVPDTQYETERHPAVLRSQMRWLAANRGPRNIAMVLHEGDVVNAFVSSQQWKTAATELANIDGKVPFVVAVGNHDEMQLGGGAVRPYPVRPERFNNLVDGFRDYHTSGAFRGGDYRNTYHLFSAGGVDLMVLNLEFGAPDDVLAWAADVVDAHPDRHVLLLTHDYLDLDGTWRGSSDPGNPGLPHNYNPALNDGVVMWNEFVSRHPNVQFTFNGHVTASKSAEEPWSVARAVDRNNAGGPVYETLTNYQSWLGGQGYLRLFHFDRTGHVVDVDSYSPSTGQHLTTDDNRFSFSGVDLGKW